MSAESFAPPAPAGMEIAAIVLAAGRGTRFDPAGVRCKLLQPLPDGRLVIQAVCETMLASLDAVTVVCGDRINDIRAALAALPVNIAHCADADIGMGASIRRGLAGPAPELGWLMMLGDMPFLQPSTVERVVQSLRAGALIARPYCLGSPGHPVAFSAVLGPELRECDPQAGLQAVIKRHAAQLTRIDVDDQGCTSDIDTPDDLPGGGVKPSVR